MSHLITIFFLSSFCLIQSADLWEYYIGEYATRDNFIVLATGSKARRFEEKQNNRLTVSYPEDLGPQGGEVRTAYFRVGMDNDGGRLIISDGGIGQHFLEAIVEADFSSFIECNYSIYGVEPFKRPRRTRFRGKPPRRNATENEEMSTIPGYLLN